MPDFTAFDGTTGRVLARGSAPTEEACFAQVFHPNERILIGLIPDGHFVDPVSKQPVAFPPQPSPSHVFDFSKRAWFDPRSLDDKKRQLKDRIAEQRWKAETGGLTLADGSRIGTTREQRAALAQQLADMEARAIATVDFKTVDGFVTLTLDGVRAMSHAVFDHVQACFSAERRACDFIDALDEAGVSAGCDLADFLVAGRANSTPLA